MELLKPGEGGGGRFAKKRFPVQERVEEDLRAGAFAALKANFAPGVEIAADHKFPYRAEVEVTPVEGEPGQWWMSVTLYSRSNILTSGGVERACLVISGDDLMAVVKGLVFSIEAMKNRHLRQKPPADPV